ncbi:threonine/serine exporter family protein [Thiorhodococcus minor]|uniref:threonine/serine exporter family protein n=1 Tax=Thiorhodococcus minor TaxID=57489 RepID=UPI0024765238|nr:threonine/serine exporter family protein [Thiorhodococcus minor]
MCQTVVRAGALMAAAGTGVYRVKEETSRVGAALGLDAVHAAVTLNTLIATCRQGGRSHTLVETIPAISVNAGRIAAMESLTLELRPGATPAAARLCSAPVRARAPGTRALTLTPLEVIDHLAAQLVRRLAAASVPPPSLPRRDRPQLAPACASHRVWTCCSRQPKCPR